ncbi:MAG: SMI1/KNR4 family protein [Myxococcales bacterium]|nr:SMI1/KNR4 family protein [Myxococcales bacterium]
MSEIISIRLRRLTDRNVIPTLRPRSEELLAGLEADLGWQLPPRTRELLSSVGPLELPPTLAVVHSFLGPTPGPYGSIASKTAELVARCPAARHMVVLGVGAVGREWFCAHLADDLEGEPPIYLYDATDGVLEGVFYDNYEAMLCEVLDFVDEITALAPGPLEHRMPPLTM